MAGPTAIADTQDPVRTLWQAKPHPPAHFHVWIPVSTEALRAEELEAEEGEEAGAEALGSRLGLQLVRRNATQLRLPAHRRRREAAQLLRGRRLLVPLIGNRARGRQHADAGPQRPAAGYRRPD